MSHSKRERVITEDFITYNDWKGKNLLFCYVFFGALSFIQRPDDDIRYMVRENLDPSLHWD